MTPAGAWRCLGAAAPPRAGARAIRVASAVFAVCVFVALAVGCPGLGTPHAGAAGWPDAASTGLGPADSAGSDIGRILDLGRPRDAWAVLEGFHDREQEAASGLTIRWTSSRSSFVWVPSTALSPREIAFRAKAPGEVPVRLSVAIDGVAAGGVEVGPGEFAEARLALEGAALARMTGAEPVRVELTSPVFVPKAAGGGDDPRELGIVLDRVVVR